MKTYDQKLIILRGNSGSGKSTVARKLREESLARKGTQKIALVEQDYLRRIVLKEKESEGEDNISLIFDTVVFALERNYHVILEGILYSGRYKGMLQQLIGMCPENHCYYFRVSFEETLRRHASKPNSHEFGEAEMRSWYRDNDMLGVAEEQVIPEASSIKATVSKIRRDTGI